MDELISLIRSYGVARLGAIIGVTAGVAIAMALIVMRIGDAPLQVLYADISYSEAQRVVSRLEQEGVRHELRDTGARASILVPRDKTAELRLALAADGVIAGSGVGYEIFDETTALGATSFQQNMNRLRALEGELARTISSISGVRAARVHLVMPERELFARERETASASIVVDAPTGLDARTVTAIVNLTASAVPGLEPTGVTVLDSAGGLLASATASGDDIGALNGAIEDKKAAAEAKIRRAVEDIIGRIVGSDNVRVEVAADMDFSRVTESAEIIDPDSQTVLSTTTVEETSSDRDANAARTVSVANGLPGAQGADPTGASATSSSQRTEETTNYEITKTVRNAVREEGLVVKRLSVAVAVNSLNPETGAPVARNAEDLERLETLVRSAVGFTASRGDQVSVIDVPFQAAPAPIATPQATQSAPLVSREDVMRSAEIGALVLIALSLIIFVLRPMLSTNAAQTPAGAAASQQLSSPDISGALPSPSAVDLETHIDLAKIDGQVKASSINKVSEIVKAHTDESANILRNWMREAS